jgi:hypothetical protein
MYTAIYLLPQYDNGDANRYRQRWNDQSKNGPSLHNKILDLMSKELGKHFLQWHFEQHQLGFMESEFDLRGFSLSGVSLKFPSPKADFTFLDFKYAVFYHTTFSNAAFCQCSVDFGRFYNCEFRDCLFAFQGFYGATFEKCRFINCEFREYNSFTNCDMKETVFQNCFIPENVFVSCRFDDTTQIDSLAQMAFSTYTGMGKDRSLIAFDPQHEAAIWGGLRDAYEAGGVADKAQKHQFLRMRSTTRYNTVGVGKKALRYLLEYITGYGLKPQRVVGGMLVTLLASCVYFSLQVGVSDGLVMATGAFFTFGAKADLLDKLPLISRIVYIATSFLGVALVASLITVLANVWFRER